MNPPQRKSTSSRKSVFRVQNLRRVVQVLVFVLFVHLFFVTIGVYDTEAKHTVVQGGVDAFFHIDPLLSLTTAISARYFIHTMLFAGIVVLLTVVLGRFFCGWICPMGTAIDASDTLFFRKSKVRSRKSKEGTAGARNVKYYLLIGVLVAAVFSSQLAYILDPFAIITRAFTFVVFPIVQLGMRSAGQVPAISDNAPFLTSSPYIPSDVQYFFRLNFLAAAMFIAILALGSISRRYWCRNLCPLGALLGLLSKVSIIRRLVDSSCIKCSKCKDCKMGAIVEDPTQYLAPECIYCYSCTHTCPTGVTQIVPSFSSEGHQSILDLTRRRTLQAMGIGAMVAVLGKTNVAAKSSKTGKVKTSSEALIRPPGAVAEDEFVNKCLRCSECMKVCPTGGLQPALTEAGFEGMWTPVLVPRIGECTEKCNLCGEVCASKAIEPFEIEEKKHIYIGRAVIDRSKCIAWNSDKKCLVCDEHCSYHALNWKTVDGLRRPFVDDNKCTGCGICENACPIQPVAAIRSFSFGDQRHKTREEQKAFFEQGQKKPEGPALL